MRLYWELARRAFQRQLAYRTANLAGLVTNAFFGYIRAMVFVVAFTGVAQVEGYDARALATFTWMTQALIMVVNLWGGIGVGETIASGAVISDLSKPFSFLGYWLSRECGRAIYYLVFRCAPILLVGQLMFGLRWPERLETWLYFGISVALAVAVSFAWGFMVELTGFWTIQTQGIRQLALSVVLFFSGFIVPIPLFPEWLRAAAQALPFAAISQVPCDIFLERHSAAEIVQALSSQLFWAVALLALTQRLVVVATRRVVSQGG